MMIDSRLAMATFWGGVASKETGLSKGTPMRLLLPILATLIALTTMAIPSAHAQETTAPAPGTEAQEQPMVASPWSFNFTTYLWMASLEGQVGAAGLPPVDVDASFSDIFQNIDWTPPPVMFAGAVRYDRFGFVTDFIYLGVEGEGDLVGPGLVTAQAEIDTVIWTFAGAYRAFENKTVSLDLLAGGRLWSLSTDVTVSGLVSGQASGSKNWVDPLVGVASRVNLGSGFALRAEGDVGGFGVSADIDWQVIGTLQYEINDTVALEAGYRYLAVDYEDDGFVFDASMSGPIIGASFRF